MIDTAYFNGENWAESESKQENLKFVTKLEEFRRKYQGRENNVAGYGHAMDELYTDYILPCYTKGAGINLRSQLMKCMFVVYFNSDLSDF